MASDVKRNADPDAGKRAMQDRIEHERMQAQGTEAEATTATQRL